MKKYEELEHTADLGLRIYGQNLRAILANASEGMFSLIGEINDPQRQTRKVHKVHLEVPFSDPSIPRMHGVDSSESAEDLLPAWLRRLLTEFNLHAFFPVEYAIELDDHGVMGDVKGALFDPGKDIFYTEIKGVTFHALKVTKINTGWQADVIFDV